MATMTPLVKSTNKTSKYVAVPAGDYPARMVRFIGLGIQPRRAFKDPRTGVVAEKSPAFEVGIQFELFDPETAQPLMAIEFNNNGERVKTDRPSCQFYSPNLFPNMNKGHVFDLCQALESSVTESPADLDWFFERLGAPVMVTVNNYQDRYGNTKSSIKKVFSCPKMVANMMPAAKSELIGFNPYSESEEDKVAYAKMFPFQREKLGNAQDASNIPLAGTAPVDLSANNQPEQTKPEVAEATQPAGFTAFDEDIPF